MIAGAIVNPDGKVAVRYKQPIDKYVKVLGNEYLFTARFSVSLAWVDESDVPALLTQPPKRSCCGGGAGSEFSLANQASVNCWKDGSR